MTALSCLKGRDVKVWAATEVISEFGCHPTARETWLMGQLAIFCGEFAARQIACANWVWLRGWLPVALTR